MSYPDRKLRRMLTTMVGAALALGVAGTAAAQSIVVRSTGPSATKYPAGTKLKPTEKITLVDGDKVVVLDKGKTRTFAGKGSYAATGPVQGTQTVSSTVTRMISKQGSARSRGGFTRGPGDPVPAPGDARSPNLWVVDIRHGGTFCVADPATLLFWRPDMTSDALLTLETGSGAAAKSQSLAYVSGANYVKWPRDAVPFATGADYRVSGVGLPAPVTLRFASVDAMPETVEATVDLLLAKGCKAQLDLLVDTLADEAARPAA
ncbi:MAG: hypothetical protein RLZZ58_1937 [Pseudomonadota bacterium]|jgi:hypothetical protein